MLRAAPLVVVLSFMLCRLGFSPASAVEPAKKNPAPTSKFVRLNRDAAGKPLTLDTAIVRYVGTRPDQAGLVVDLVGAVHVGERSYYEQLNKRFAEYDVVLYELVAPPGTRITKDTKGGNHPVRMIQNGMKDFLLLEHQLEHIDYLKPNLMHADMSPDDFARSMHDRGESLLGMYFRLMGEAMARQSSAKSGASDLQLLLALLDENRAVAIKQLLAEQFEDLEGAMRAFGGPQGSTIVTERNNVALAKLKEQIAAGSKRIAIFYGAAHFPDMEQKLLGQFNLKRTTQHWLPAWNLQSELKKSQRHPS